MRGRARQPCGFDVRASRYAVNPESALDRDISSIVRTTIVRHEYLTEYSPNRTRSGCGEYAFRQ